MLKRLFDIIFAFYGILFLLPLLIILGLWVGLSSKGGVFYFQKRVGKNGVDFSLFKFRTMYIDSDKKGLLTVGMQDRRITKAGLFLRKYKLSKFLP